MLSHASRAACRRQTRSTTLQHHRSYNTWSASQRSFATGVKLLEQKGKGQEAMYFAQEDEKLIKKLLENPEFAADTTGIASGDSVEEKVKLVFLNHGIPPLNKKLIADLVAILQPPKK